MRFPENISPIYYFDILVQVICKSYGLMPYIEIIRKIMYELYMENNVFNETYDPKWANEHSKNITLQDFYKKCVLREQKNQNFIDADCLNFILKRMIFYKNENCLENRLFCNKQGNSIDFLLKQKNYLVLDTKNLFFASNAFFCCLLVETFCKANLVNDLMFVLDDCSPVFDNYPNFLFEHILYDKRECIGFCLLIESIKNLQGKLIGDFSSCYFDEIYIGKIYNPIQNINKVMKSEFLNNVECDKISNLKYGEFLRKK